MVISMKAARVNANLSQIEAAKALGVSRGSIQNYEKGKTVPQFDLAKKMAALYGVSIDDIKFYM